MGCPRSAEASTNSQPGHRNTEGKRPKQWSPVGISCVCGEGHVGWVEAVGRGTSEHSHRAARSAVGQIPHPPPSTGQKRGGGAGEQAWPTPSRAQSRVEEGEQVWGGQDMDSHKAEMPQTSWEPPTHLGLYRHFLLQVTT